MEYYSEQNRYKFLPSRADTQGRRQTVFLKKGKIYNICMVVNDVEEKDRRIRSSGVREGSVQFKTVVRVPQPNDDI